MGFLEKIFGSYSQRELKRIEPIAKQVFALEDQFKAMSDEELKGITPKLKEQLAQGYSLDSILPEAFAACRIGEAAFPGTDYRRHCTASGTYRRNAHR